MQSRIVRILPGLAVAGLLGLAGVADAQLVPIRSVPVATGDQFILYPSLRLGMASVSIAVDDPLLDPFVNPAKGTLLERTQVWSAPGYYTIEHGSGSGRTFPIGLATIRGDWFGGAAVALQQLTPARQWGGCCWIMDARRGAVPDPDALSNRSQTNSYGFGSLGRRLAGGATSVGTSVAVANLSAIDGVDLLYSGSQSIRQNGSTGDVRLGMVHNLGGGRRLEGILLHNRLRMTHDVRYVDFTWQPGWQQPEVRVREERNEDHTNMWGAHFGYLGGVGEDGWRFGGAATLNYMNHPKIPNYEIMNIPRDPGHSWAYNVGGGASREEGPFTFAIEAVLEPIWSNTWADSDTTVTSVSGLAVAPGGKVIENDFRFSNSHLRIGVGRGPEQGWGFQLGLHVHSIRYDLVQHDFVTERTRDQSEDWMEWTPSWSLSRRFPELEVRYTGRLTSGTGRPGIAWVGGARGDAALASAPNFIVAPSGPLSLQESRVFSHVMTVSLPVTGVR